MFDFGGMELKIFTSGRELGSENKEQAHWAVFFASLISVFNIKKEGASFVRIMRP